ncbi:MAG: hypothetical protein QG618_2285 [Thermodesulfobacteriota bacterium]|nr:hypothetical protein [Thermodesulfobacteriota bacterium]
MAKRVDPKIDEEDIVLLKRYRIKSLNKKIKRYGGLWIAAGGIISSVLFNIPIIGLVSFSVIPIFLVLLIFPKL